MNDNVGTITITGGTDVFGADGDKVGSVADMRGDYVVVSKGFFFPTDYYVPTNAINTVNDDGVFLNVTKDEALNQGWDAEPRDFTATAATYDGQVAPEPGLHIENPVDTASPDGGYAEDGRPFGHRTDAGATHVDDAQAIHVPLGEEELTARTREVDRGTVRIEKEVVEEDAALDVPVTEERVRISRHAADGDIQPGDVSFEDGSIEIPLRGQEVEADRHARVREVLDVDKTTVEETRHVTGKVRREEAHVVDEKGADIVDETDRRAR